MDRYPLLCWLQGKTNQLKCQSSTGIVTFEVCQGVLCIRKACAVSCKFIIVISYDALCSGY